MSACSLFVVLITDFADCNRIVGPFPTKADAYRWAETNVRDIYRVVEMEAPDEAPAVVAQQPG